VYLISALEYMLILRENKVLSFKLKIEPGIPEFQKFYEILKIQYKIDLNPILYEN